MTKTVPLQDSVPCGGKYCTSFVHPSNGKLCRGCGSYLCPTCVDEQVYCKECEDEITSTEDLETSHLDPLMNLLTHFVKEDEEQTPATNPAYAVMEEGVDEVMAKMAVANSTLPIDRD